MSLNTETSNEKIGTIIQQLNDQEERVVNQQHLNNTPQQLMRAISDTDKQIKILNYSIKRVVKTKKDSFELVHKVERAIDIIEESPMFCFT